MIEGQFFPSGIQPVQFEGGRPYNRWLRKDFKEIIDGLGLSSGLKLCLDAGDSASLASSATKWNDLSGNGYDFNFGSGAGADAADPTQNGTPNALTSAEYLSFDGGDYLTYDTTNETWMQNIHKNNAVFTLAAWVYCGSASASGWAGTNGNSAAAIGFEYLTFGGAFLFRVANGSGSYGLSISVGGVVDAAWNFCAVSVDEGAGTGVTVVNGTSGSFTSTYTSPSASNATRTLQLAALGNGAAPPPSGMRQAGFMAWEGVALTAAQLKSVFTATRGRFGV